MSKVESKYFKISWCLISIGKCDDNRIVKAVKENENCIKIKWKMGAYGHISKYVIIF
jgi:hypothetical protein